jgi:dUTP pyrophosphatase
MKLKVKKLNPLVKLPAYAHPGDAGMDIFSSEHISLEPGQYLAVATGLAFEIPKGFVGLIWDKSGLSTNHGMKVLGGVIDSGYRGEIRIGIINLSKKVYIFEPGDKVAQMLIQKIEIPKIVEIQLLSETKRGSKGFGSTGKK